MLDQPVIVFSTSLGSHVGVLREHDGATVTLAPARSVRWEAKGVTILDVAVDGLGKRQASVSAQIAGPVVLTDVTMLAPLSDAACKSIVRVSEDNLSLVNPPTE